MMQQDDLLNASTYGGTPEDITAIKRLIEDAVKYQNDPDLFLPLHAPDAVIVNFVGRRVLGRDALERAMQKALSGSLAKVLTTNVIEDIRFVRPDVALVSCVKHVSDERDKTSEQEGSSLPAENGALTYVVVKGTDGWMISLAQTTPMIMG